MSKTRYSKPPSEKEIRSFKKYLSEDEELVIATSYGNAYLRQKFIIQILLPGAIFILLGIGIGFLKQWEFVNGVLLGLLLSLAFSILKTIHTFHAHRYILTTRRIIIKNGVFNVKIASALYDKITHIEVDQGIIDRLFLRHGLVIIHTAGTSKDEMVLQYVEHPVEFKNLLERLIHQERERFNKQTLVQAIEGEVVS